MNYKSSLFDDVSICWIKGNECKRRCWTLNEWELLFTEISLAPYAGYSECPLSSGSLATCDSSSITSQQESPQKAENESPSLLHASLTLHTFQERIISIPWIIKVKTSAYEAKQSNKGEVNMVQWWYLGTNSTSIESWPKKNFF